MSLGAGLRNYLSYWAVEDYIYLGLRRPLRRFRKRLGLPPLRAVEGTQRVMPACDAGASANVMP
jgi:hypothetical protein